MNSSALYHNVWKPIEIHLDINENKRNIEIQKKEEQIETARVCYQMQVEWCCCHQRQDTCSSNATWMIYIMMKSLSTTIKMPMRGSSLGVGYPPGRPYALHDVGLSKMEEHSKTKQKIRKRARNEWLMFHIYTGLIINLLENDGFLSVNESCEFPSFNHLNFFFISFFFFFFLFFFFVASWFWLETHCPTITVGTLSSNE